jgi:hypothetical protein
VGRDHINIVFGSLIATLCKLEMYLHRFLVLKTFELDKAINTGKRSLERNKKITLKCFSMHTHIDIYYIYIIYVLCM